MPAPSLDVQTRGRNRRPALAGGFAPARSAPVLPRVRTQHAPLQIGPVVRANHPARLAADDNRGAAIRFATCRRFPRLPRVRKPSTPRRLGSGSLWGMAVVHRAHRTTLRFVASRCLLVWGWPRRSRRTPGSRRWSSGPLQVALPCANPMPFCLGTSCERLDLLCERTPSLSPTLNITLSDLGSRGITFPDFGALEGLLGQRNQEGEISEKGPGSKGAFLRRREQWPLPAEHFAILGRHLDPPSRQSQHSYRCPRLLVESKVVGIVGRDGCGVCASPDVTT
jgi:hypothetical protein